MTLIDETMTSISDKSNNQFFLNMSNDLYLNKTRAEALRLGISN